MLNTFHDSARKRRSKAALRMLVPACTLGLCAVLLVSRLAHVSFGEVWENMAAVSPLRWGMALMFSAVSYWAIGRYDRAAHRHFETGINERMAQYSGTAAIALAQTLGFGVAVGALVRWRMLPTLAPPMAVKISVLVSISFMASLGIVTALAIVFLDAQQPLFVPAICILLATPIFAGFLILGRTPTLFGKRITLPSLHTCVAFFGWSVVDLGAALLAFYVLLPTGTVELAVLAPVFCIAIGAALLSGTPAGLGPFELSMIAALPIVAEPALLCGILGFRIVYYAIPAIIAACVLARPFQTQTAICAHHCPATTTQIAEARVIRQNGGKFENISGTVMALWPNRHSLVSLFDPSSKLSSFALTNLLHAAKRSGKTACLYKIGARQAAIARVSGWKTFHIANEAIIDPQRFDTNVRPCRSLRRKLGKAERAGVQAHHTLYPDIPALAEIDARWCQQKGGAKGATMGRFAPEHITDQHVFVAHSGDVPVAFISFHHNGTEWCLDLIRALPTAPDGTMHMLVCAAIQHAQQNKVARLSLAAVPAGLIAGSPVVSKFTNAAGLFQFKNCFAPLWEPRYLAAPSYGAALICAADIARAVTRPDPALDQDLNGPHEDDAEIEFATPMPS